MNVLKVVLFVHELLDDVSQVLCVDRHEVHLNSNSCMLVSGWMDG